MNDYYGSEDAGTGTSATPAPDNTADTPDEEEAGETFLVPIDALGEGVEVGQKCQIQVVRLFEDEAECKYVDSETGTGEPKSAMDQSMSNMDEMAVQKG